jgi:organic radical activating enzyme
MYLQITTKCNMKCAHCCYSCGRHGKHMDYHVAIDAIAFIRDYDECISIGGGEPTLHPRFFDILRYCLNDFDYVWMATNGSQTKTMRRLANIIDDDDWSSFDPEDYCNCGDDRNNCYCEPPGLIYQEDKLTVALSQDSFHDEISPEIVALWKHNSIRNGHFEIRNVSQSHNGIVAQGRAKRTGSGWNTESCVCATNIIRPDGKIKMCGCSNAPIIGDVWSGIDFKWTEIMSSNQFLSINCWKAIASERLKKAA